MMSCAPSRHARLTRSAPPTAHSGARRNSVSSTAAPVRPCAARALEYRGKLTDNGAGRYAVVVGKFNSLVTKLLLEGAMEGLESAGVPDDNIVVSYVPGSFEIPVVAKSMARTGRFDAVICIGAVVRGATTHYEEVCSAATSGCLDASSSTGTPVIFGVITTETMEQALDRAGGKVGNKGTEAALTAVEMASLMQQLRRDEHAAEAVK